MIDVYTPKRFPQIKYRIADWVISEIAAFGDDYVRREITRTTQKFMREKLDEATALIAAYTLCVRENHYAH